MMVHVFKSYQPQADISINKPRKHEVGDTQGDFIPQFRCRKAGGYMGKVIFLKSHLREQAELFL